MNTTINSLSQFVNSKVQINQGLADAIDQACRVEELPKGTLLLKEGQVAHRLFLMIQGTARTFYYYDGKEVTSWIYREAQLLTAWGSFLSRTPSHEQLELLEDATLCSIAYPELQQLYAQYPRMQTFGRITAEEQLAYIDNFYKGFLFMSAKEKYDLLLSAFPDLTQRVNLGHIASLLGISQETLSRIRSKK
ncbi:MAG: Crp/Fnr family transcriptional regulator [Bacteroidota bacterium]